MQKLFLSILILLFSQFVNAQTFNLSEDPIFKQNEIANIYITMSTADKSSLLAPENSFESTFYNCAIRFTNSEINEVATGAGIRLRGNTSRGHTKKSLKIDFREFGGSKFYDYKKFNLKPNVNDPSAFREQLSMRMMREMGIPAARTHLVKLYINDEYMGIYTNVEQIDDEFIDDRWGREDGWLYKCSFGANLLDDGQVENNSLYESEINKSTDTRAHLRTFVNVLNNTGNSVFSREIEKIFEVDLFLRYLAVEAIIGHWDGYSYNQNNYYLYYNSRTLKWIFIPYDTDNTWGIDWIGRDWGTRNLNGWHQGDGAARPLTKRILDVPAYEAKYRYYIALFIDRFFNETWLTPHLSQARELLDQAVKDDVYFGLSFGFSHQDFWNAFTSQNRGHVKYGILDFVKTRQSCARQQIVLPAILSNAVTSKHKLMPYPNPAKDAGFYIHSNESINIYDQTGKVIVYERKQLIDNQDYISLSNLKPGVYLINVSGEIHKWVYQ